MNKNPLDIYFGIKEGVIKLAKKENSAILFNNYLAILRVMNILFQHAHWKCKGDYFYSNHLLFQRLYTDTNELIDLTAEKIIGIYGNDNLYDSKQLSIMSDMFSKFENSNMIDNCIEATNAFLTLSQELYNELKESKEITLGVDDMIMASASKAEEFIYLLKQVKE